MCCRRAAVLHRQIAATSDFNHTAAAGHFNYVTVQVKGNGVCHLQRRVDGIILIERYCAAAVQ